MTLIAGIMSLWLPETLLSNMYETVEDVETSTENYGIIWMERPQSCPLRLPFCGWERFLNNSLESSANEKLEVHRTGKSSGEGCVGDLHNLIRGSKSGADWWEHSSPINVATLLERAVGKGVGSDLHNLIRGRKVAQWWDHSPPINVAILLERAVGRGVGSDLHNLIGGSKSVAD